MSYIGNNLQVAYPSYLIIDDISSQFNGVLKTFALRVAGSTPVPFPINPQQCLISVNNIVQKPDSTGVSGFTLTGSNIVFATAPTAGWSFFGTILAGADYVNVGANFPSGTAAIPSVTFDQSTGTGLFLASSNVLGITTGGVQRLVVNSSGFVGIGTSSPSSFLHLAAASGTVQMQFNSGGTSSYIGHDSAFTGFDIAAGGGIKFRYFNGASFAEAMRITSAGLLGVGTSSPDASYRATIAGSRSAVAPGIFFSDTDASPNNYSLYIDGTKNFVIRDSTNSLNRITVTPAGLVGIGVSGPSSLLHLVSSGQPTITVADDAGRTLQVKSPDGSANPGFVGTTTNHDLLLQAGTTAGGLNVMRFTTAGAERVRITDAGRVGIGTSSPGYALDVQIATSSANTGARIYNSTAGTGNSASLSFSVANAFSSTNQHAAIQAISEVSTNTLTSLAFLTSGGSNVGNATERARIDSSGRLLVGASATQAGNGGSDLLQVTGAINVVSSTNIYSRLLPTASGLEIISNAYPANLGSTQSIIFKSGTSGGGGPSEIARFTSDGMLGIGTTAPDSTLHVLAGAVAGLRIGFNGTSVNYYDADTQIFRNIAGTERARIDSSGRLLVGTSTARTAAAYGVAGLQVESTYFANSSISAINNQATSDGSALLLGKSRGTAIGSNTIVQASDVTGYISFQGADGTALLATAAIYSQVDGTPGANDMPGRLVFSTTADGASSPTERMRIESNGNTRLSNLAVIHPTTDNAVTSGGSGFRWSEVWAANGTIQTSDYRTKTGITDAALGSDFINLLRPVSYMWVEGGKRDTGERDKDGNYIYESVPGARTHWGFIAQEVKQAVDAAGVDFGGWVLTDKDDPDSQQALRYDQFIAPLTKALQETMAELEVLKAEVAALKAQ